MFAVVLAGGLGTRLRPYTYAIPKPLLPIGERPVLDVLLHRLKLTGVTDVALCLGYMAPLISAFVGEGERWDLNVSCVVEQEPLGTAGPLQLIHNLPEHFIVANGDTLTDLDFKQLHAFHRERESWLTAFAPEIEDLTDYGILDIEDANAAIKQYIEKPVRRFNVSSGIYAVAKRMLDYLPIGRRFDMPDLVSRALEDKRPVFAFRAKAYWRDIGRMDHFEAANRDFQEDPGRFLGTGSCRQKP